jgi:nicotinic acid phosphoribosyltransferase
LQVVTAMPRSLLATDGYKFSMAEAGWPLRRETFYYAHRRGGAQLVPLDLEALVRSLLPLPVDADYAYLASHEYEMGIGFKAAIKDASEVTVSALPRGSVFLPREPVVSITGPSAIVSWLEPLLLQLNYRIQIATLAHADPVALARAVRVVTCDAQKAIVLETLDAVGVRPPPIDVDEAGYRARVIAQAKGLVAIVEDASRIFEVGLRAATCVEQHRIALEACKSAGVLRTSHVELARDLGMVPVGTMGHEHVQRYGSDDAAFRAMRERRPQRSSYLLDTFDTMASGIPVAFDLICESKTAGDSIRFDSGDKEAQYRFATTEALRRGIRPVMILEDGFDAEMTARFEVLRHEVGWRENEQFYGYGGYLVARTAGSELTRDRVAAVYKLSQTGRTPTMKFGNEITSGASGKESIPGRPIVFRRRAGHGGKGDLGRGPLGIVAQEGELPPDGWVRLTGASEEEGRALLAPGANLDDAELALGMSPQTTVLIDALRKKRLGPS